MHRLWWLFHRSWRILSYFVLCKKESEPNTSKFNQNALLFSRFSHSKKKLLPFRESKSRRNAFYSKNDFIVVFTQKTNIYRKLSETTPTDSEQKKTTIKYRQSGCKLLFFYLIWELLVFLICSTFSFNAFFSMSNDDYYFLRFQFFSFVDCSVRE